MATALLAYSGIAVKMLVDQRLGAVLHQMFMVEYEPGGVAQPHDHPFEETYYVLDGKVDATPTTSSSRSGRRSFLDRRRMHSRLPQSQRRASSIPRDAVAATSANYSYRFNRDWDYLAGQLDRGGTR